MSKDILLNFINRSNDANNSQIVIFQKNVAASFDEMAVAWKVIQNCGFSDNHPFAYPMETEVCAADSWGNYTPRLDATNNQLFSMSNSLSGATLNYVGPATSPYEVQVRNELDTGAISAGIYKDGRLLAQKRQVAPGQEAVFAFKPTLWIGAVSDMQTGELMSAPIISDINTELSLLGIASADIVMTGGGSGPTSPPLTFHLENVVRA